MEFNFLNLTGGVIVLLILLPNILYAVKGQAIVNHCHNRSMLILEQVGRYGCMALMILPLGVGEFGFRSSQALVIWCAIGLALLLGYYVCWFLWFRKPRRTAALLLAILPCLLFLGRGLVFRHWLLVGCAVIFAVGHIYITCCNNRTEAADHE